MAFSARVSRLPPLARMNMKNLFLILLSVLAVSCVPVYYDNKLFKVMKSGSHVDGVRVGVVLDAKENNAFNSRSRGGWKILVAFASKSKHDVKISRLIVKRGNGVLMDSHIAETVHLVEHPHGGQWGNTYQSREVLMFETNEGETIRIDAFVSVDGGSDVKISSRFEAAKIKGLEWVNVLTM